MKQFYLEEIITKDKLIHQGIFFTPKKPQKRAILWVPGLTSTFYADNIIFQELIELGEKEGVGFAAFNNRGHDYITGIRKVDKTSDSGYTHVTQGAGYEVFEESVHDIDAGVSFLAKKGFSEIILIGHSTGANKACYYTGLLKDSRVVGVVLASPLSDRLDTTLDNKQHIKNMKYMKKLVAHGKGDTLVMGFFFFPITPKRFLSIFTPHSNEDTFDYGDEEPKLIHFSSIHIPLLVTIGGSDEYLDRSSEDLQKIFDSHAKSHRYKSFILKYARHGYDGKEKEFAQAVWSWLKSI